MSDSIVTVQCRGCGYPVRTDQAREVRRDLPEIITANLTMIGCVWVDLYHLDCLPNARSHA